MIQGWYCNPTVIRHCNSFSSCSAIFSIMTSTIKATKCLWVSRYSIFILNKRKRRVSSKGGLFFFFFFFATPHMEIPQLGTEPMPPSLEELSLNYWTTRKVPEGLFLMPYLLTSACFTLDAFSLYHIGHLYHNEASQRCTLTSQHLIKKEGKKGIMGRQLAVYFTFSLVLESIPEENNYLLYKFKFHVI